MKYCLSSRQEHKYLEKADEIKIEFRDRNAIPDIAKKYPNAALVVEVPPAIQWEIDDIKIAFTLTKKKLILCLPKIGTEFTEQLKELKIPFYWGYKVNTPYELEAVKKCGVCAVRAGAPLFFQTDVLKRAGIPVRAIANLAHDDYFPYGDGINGTWIRPEDVEKYEGIVETIDFTFENLEQEQALYRIYAERHEWPGRVDMYIKNIETEAENRMIPPTLVDYRLNCRQMCSEGKCSICYHYFSMANPELLKSYQK